LSAEPAERLRPDDSEVMGRITTASPPPEAGALEAMEVKIMTSRMFLTIAAMFFSSLGAVLRLYAAAFIGVRNDIDPLIRAMHQQSEWAA
jgi:hypothetical protein